MKLRIAHVTADAVTLGIACGYLLNLIDWMLRYDLENITLHALIRVRLLAWVVRASFFSGKYFASQIGWSMAIVAALWVWHRTRPLAAVVVSTVAAVCGVWSAVLLCVIAYIFSPTAGIVGPAAALIPAVWLARQQTWSITTMVILACGVAAGALCAQIICLLWLGAWSVLYGFVPPVLVAFLVAWLVSRYSSATEMSVARRMARFWGLCAAGLLVTYFLALEIHQFRAREAEPPATRVVDGWAYDVYVFGEPPVLLWTTRERAEVLDNAYGETHGRYVLDESALMVERIWRSSNGDFYLQANRQIGWWTPVPDGQRIPYRPTAWLPEPEWVLSEASTSSTGTFVEDPVTHRFMVFSEWMSHYAVIDRDSGSVLATGIMSDFLWPWWYATMDAAARIAFISTPFDDGGLYEFNFDSLETIRRAPNLFLYETVLDPSSPLLWGIRPMTGEVISVDRRTLEIQSRVPVEATIRDIQLDAETGDLFTCAFLSGNIFRVDRKTMTPSRIGWCGRFCRNLFLDPQHRTLWAATVDGVCRIPIDQAGAALSPARGMPLAAADR